MAFDLHYQHNKPTIIKLMSLFKILKVDREEARLAQLVARQRVDPEIRVQTSHGQISMNKFSELTGLVQSQNLMYHYVQYGMHPLYKCYSTITGKPSL